MTLQIFTNLGWMYSIRMRKRIRRSCWRLGGLVLHWHEREESNMETINECGRERAGEHERVVNEGWNMLENNSKTKRQNLWSTFEKGRSNMTTDGRPGWPMATWKRTVKLYDRPWVNDGNTSNDRESSTVDREAKSYTKNFQNNA